MKKTISIILVIVWMSLIFILSSSNSNESNEQSGRIVTFISQIFNISNIEMLNYVIRKIAHITEFFVLGILVMNLIHCYNKKTYIAIILCIIYAISDEFHQSLVPGRSPQIYDVLIDTVGSSLGISIYKLLTKIANINKVKKKINKQ